MPRPIALCIVLCFASLALLPLPHARADALDASWTGSAAPLSPAMAAALYVEGERAPSTPEDIAAGQRVTRARSLVIVGASMVLSSLVSSVVIQTAGRCTYDGESASLALPHGVSASFGAVGVGLVALGATRLARADTHARRSAHTSRRTGIVRIVSAFGASLLTAAASSAATYASLANTYGCIHS
jgi:hypothetical protein